MTPRSCMLNTAMAEDFNYDPYFYSETNANTFQPSSRCIGPWDPEQQHGGPPIALLGQCFYRYQNDMESFVTRITAEILGPVSLDPMAVKVSVARAGKRIELLEGSITQNGRVVLRGLCWRFRVGRSQVMPFDEGFSVPLIPDRESLVRFPTVANVPYIESMEWRFVVGGFDIPGKAILWTRPKVPLIDGESTSSLAKALLMLDSANGASSVLSFTSNLFVPVDMTLALLRTPEGDWIGMEAETAIGELGSGITKTVLFDAFGYVGSTLHTLFVETRGT